MRNINDLLYRAKRGDREAFTTLMEDHGKLLYNTALLILKNEEDALDAMQDAVLACWENLPTLRQDRYFKTWLTRILLNKCTDILRERNHWAPESRLAEQGDEADWDTPIDVRETMRALPVDDRLLLSLFYYEDMNVREIAKALSISEGAVRTRLTRSRKKFQAIYRQKEALSYEKK